MKIIRRDRRKRNQGMRRGLRDRLNRKRKTRSMRRRRRTDRNRTLFTINQVSDYRLIDWDNRIMQLIDSLLLETEASSKIGAIITEEARGCGTEIVI